MTVYSSDNRNVLACLKKLEEQVASSGGWLHEDLETREQAGSLCVLSPLAPKDKQSVLIDLPEQALIPYQAGWIGIRDNECYLKDDVDSSLLTPSRRALCETMLELYNLTGKIAAHRKSFVYSACDDDEEMLRKLSAARSDEPDIEFVRDAKASGTFDDFLCKRFFGS